MSILNLIHSLATETNEWHQSGEFATFFGTGWAHSTTTIGIGYHYHPDDDETYVAVVATFQMCGRSEYPTWDQMGYDDLGEYPLSKLVSTFKFDITQKPKKFITPDTLSDMALMDLIQNHDNVKGR